MSILIAVVTVEPQFFLAGTNSCLTFKKSTQTNKFRGNGLFISIDIGVGIGIDIDIDNRRFDIRLPYLYTIGIHWTKSTSNATIIG